ncbi:hypothetical protein CFI10_14580 [Marinobacterium iners]|uniref:SCP2 sterol-binding domain-containing protein n=1 Tax=Marinobacterium iners TaxID=48076 RepID=UPI001A8F898D|nr:SCP2 sterol-binding domain-containing protein [Marinobacterium iners]QSR36196.1 hypothetical protein CFI10_14580 [Marinobacterium iners]
MNVTDLRQRITNSVGEDSGLNAKVKFDLGNNEVIFIDGISIPNNVHDSDIDSDITIKIKPENLTKILDKELNPKLALMTGRMKLRGDIKIALRLDKVFGLEPSE